MHAPSSQESKLAATSFLLRISMWLGIAGAAFGMITFEFSLIFWVPAAVLASVAILQRFFTVVQIRLLELLLLLLIVGNMIGWSYAANFFSNRYVRDENYFSFGLTVVLCMVWGVGGATNGLLIAKRLRSERTAERVWLMAVFILFPFAVAAMLISALVTIAAIFSANPRCLLALPIGLVAFIFTYYAQDLRNEAMRVSK